MGIPLPWARWILRPAFCSLGSFRRSRSGGIALATCVHSSPLGTVPLALRIWVVARRILGAGRGLSISPTHLGGRRMGVAAFLRGLHLGSLAEWIFLCEKVIIGAEWRNSALARARIFGLHCGLVCGNRKKRYCFDKASVSFAFFKQKEKKKGICFW